MHSEVGIFMFQLKNSKCPKNVEFCHKTQYVLNQPKHQNRYNSGIRSGIGTPLFNSVVT